MKKEPVEYTAECTITIVVETNQGVDWAKELIQAKLDRVGLNGEIDSIDPDEDEEDDEVEE